MPTDSHWGPWELSPGLAVLITETKTKFPGIVIGTIADAHHTPPSDHIPEKNPPHYVDAADFMLGPHFTAADAESLIKKLQSDKRTKYIIFRKQIWKPSTGWRKYSGSDPHTSHIHLSVLDLSHTDTQPWQIVQREVTVALIQGEIPSLHIDDRDPILGVHYVTRAQILLNYLVAGEDLKTDGWYGKKTAQKVAKLNGGRMDGTSINNPEWIKLYGILRGA